MIRCLSSPLNVLPNAAVSRFRGRSFEIGIFVQVSLRELVTDRSTASPSPEPGGDADYAEGGEDQ
jgi:hypothetical protein